jgi:hypothetical protein
MTSRLVMLCGLCVLEFGSTGCSTHRGGDMAESFIVFQNRVFGDHCTYEAFVSGNSFSMYSLVKQDWFNYHTVVPSNAATARSSVVLTSYPIKRKLAGFPRSVSGALVDTLTSARMYYPPHVRYKSGGTGDDVLISVQRGNKRIDVMLVLEQGGVTVYQNGVLSGGGNLRPEGKARIVAALASCPETDVLKEQ